MNRQEKEKIKKAADNFDAIKLERKEAGKKLLKGIIFSGLCLLTWTFTMLLVIIITADINNGTKLFTEINSLLYQLYATLVGISIFIFLFKHVFKKKNDRIDEIIIESPSNNK